MPTQRVPTYFVVPCILIACSPCANPQRITAIRTERAEVRANMLQNGGFEEIGANGIPIGWLWDRRNTDATCHVTSAPPGIPDRSAPNVRIVPEPAHFGAHAIRITNGTPFGAHVYGALWTAAPIRLRAGTSYSLSAWVRSDDPGAAWIGGGSSWQFRLPLPRTGGRWQRAAMTFTPGSADVDFQPRINTDSPTRGLWVDDMKLEEGSPTPVEPDKRSHGAAEISPESPSPEVEGDGPFTRLFSLYVPDGAAPDRVEGRLGSGPPFRQRVSMAPGEWRIRIQGSSERGTGLGVAIRLRVMSGSNELARTEESVRFLSARGGESRLNALRAKLPALTRRTEHLRSSGQDLSYPAVSLTVLRYFIGYVDDDLTGAHGKAKPEIKRGLTQLDELEAMAARLDRELTRSRRFPDVPRWSGKQRPLVSGPSFVSEATVGGVTETRPIFFTGYGHFGQVQDDIEKLPGYGVNIIQIEVGPSAVFPSADVVDEAPITHLKSVLRRARKAGVAVCLLVSPHYLPGWMYDRYPALRKRREGFLQYCLHAPEGQALLQRFLGILIPAIKDEPALQSICLSNEPVNMEEPCEPGADLWRDWLHKRHGSIEVLNACWATKYRSFEEIPEPSPYAETAGPVRADYIRWNQEFFADWHRMLADTIHKYAPGLPVHAKAMTWTFFNDGDVRYGVDAGLFGGFSQVNGNDSVNFPSDAGSEFADGWQLNAMAGDLQRSVLNAPIFNTENHIIPDRFTGFVSAEHVRAALWQAAVHGQSATTIWVWERTFDPKSDFAGSIMHRPGCAAAVGIVNCDLNRGAREMTALQAAPPDVWILQSVSAATWDGGRYTDCLGKLYSALDLAGLKVGFVTERQLEAGLDLSGRRIFVPNVGHLSDGACRTLAHMPDGPKLYLVGGADLLSRDEYDRPRSERSPGVSVPFTYGKTTARDLWKWALANVDPAGAVRIVSADDRPEPVWGVELRSAKHRGGRVLNLCNYLSKPVTVRMIGPNGKPLRGLRDVLTGQVVDGQIQLGSLEVRLLRSF